MKKEAATGTKKRKTTKRQPMRSGKVSASPRFKRVTKRQIRWVVDRLVEALAPEKIILFGSYAYGKPHQDSDVDLLVVKASDERPTVLTGNAYRSVWGKTFPMDILVRTPDWLDARLNIGDLFIKEIVERGQVLYDQKRHSGLG